MESPFLVVTVLYASLLTLYLGILAWRKRKNSRDPMLAILLWTVTWWGIAYSIECIVLGYAAQYFWLSVKFVAIVLVPLAFLGFTAQYTNLYTGWSHRRAWPLMVVPVLTLVAVWTNPLHHLFYTSTWLDAAGVLRVKHGLFFWFHTLYSYSLLTVSSWMLVRAMLRAGRAYRFQHLTVLLAALVPWLTNILHISGASPIPWFDPTPVAFLISGGLIYLAVFYFGMLAVSPVARAVVVDQMADGMLVLDMEDRVLDVNPAILSWLDLDYARCVGRRPGEIFPQQVADAIALASLPEGQVEVSMGVAGRERFFEVMATPIADRRGRPLARMLMLRDITERKRIELSEREQREVAEVFRDIASVLNSTVDLETVLDLVLHNITRVVPHDAAHVLLLDEDWKVRHRRFKGYSPEEEQQVSQIAQWSAVQKPRREKIMRMGAVIVKDAASQSARFGHLSLFQRLPSILDVPIHFQNRLIGMLTLARSVKGFYTETHAARLQVFADQAALAIENARLYGEVQMLTLIDELTGYHNYRGLLQLGQREFDRARRFERPLSALFFDVDHFRSFNNRYTHAVGNEVLRMVAGSVLNCLRAVDLAARYGGEEFVVLLPETNLKTAVRVAERIRRSVAGTQVRTEFGELGVTISVGVAELTNDVPSFAALIERANEAEHGAKQAGRNCVATYPRGVLKSSSGKAKNSLTD